MAQWTKKNPNQNEKSQRCNKVRYSYASAKEKAVKAKMKKNIFYLLFLFFIYITKM